MGLQSGINSLIGAAGTAAALADLNSSAKSTAKTVKELGVDAKMALKARKEAQQKIDAIYANKESLRRARANIAQIMNDPTFAGERGEKIAQVINELNRGVTK